MRVMFSRRALVPAFFLLLTLALYLRRVHNDAEYAENEITLVVETSFETSEAETTEIDKFEAETSISGTRIPTSEAGTMRTPTVFGTRSRFDRRIAFGTFLNGQRLINRVSRGRFMAAEEEDVGLGNKGGDITEEARSGGGEFKEEEDVDGHAAGEFDKKEKITQTALIGENDFVPKSDRGKQEYSRWSNKMNVRQCFKNKRVYLTGTSFQRTIFWSLIRHLALQDDYDIPEDLIMISSTDSIVVKRDTNGSCDSIVNGVKYSIVDMPRPSQRIDSCLLLRDKNCAYPGPAGIDIERCGFPQHGSWTNDLNTHLHYQFKTYVKSPLVDNRIVKNLTTHDWDVVWLESGEWGSAVSTSERLVTTYEESQEFLLRISSAYKGWIVVSATSTETEQSRKFLAAAKDLNFKNGVAKSQRFLLFEQQHLVAAGRAVRIPEGHGFLGAIADSIVRSFIAAACEDFSSPYSGESDNDDT